MERRPAEDRPRGIAAEYLETNIEWLMHQGGDEITVPAIPEQSRIEAGAMALLGYYSEEIRRSESHRWREACAVAETVYRYMTRYHNSEDSYD